MWAIQYRFEILNEANANLVSIGYAPLVLPSVGLVKTDEYINSLNEAVNKAMALCRRLQSDGFLAKWRVYGKPIQDGVNVPVTPAHVLAGAELDDQLFAQGDTPEPGLTQRVNLANRETGGSTLDPDFHEDAGTV